MSSSTPLFSLKMRPICVADSYVSSAVLEAEHVSVHEVESIWSSREGRSGTFIPPIGIWCKNRTEFQQRDPAESFHDFGHSRADWTVRL